jgi:hypothetical protein
VEAPSTYPYTGSYQFVPLLKSKEWSIQKIYHLAKLHVSVINDLKTIYLVNIQDLNMVVNDSGDPLMQGFLNMTTTDSLGDAKTNKLLHSIRNTGKSTTKVALVKTDKNQDALDQFANIENLLATNIHVNYHANVFVEGPRPSISGYQVDTILSCNYSSYASELLSIHKRVKPLNPLKPRSTSNQSQ